MDPVEPGAGIAPLVAPVACRVAMFQPRVKTLQELLRKTTKISQPQTSLVLTEGARMRGPGVKEECYNCGGFVVEGELQKCSTCDRGFHASCLNKPVNTVASGEVWCCGLCDDSESLEDDTQAVDRTPGDSMTSSQTTNSLRKASTSAGKKKTTNIRGLKEVVQQEEANLLDSRLLQTDSHEGKAPEEDSVIVNQTVNAAGSDTSKSNIAGIGVEIPAELLEENKRSKRGRLLKSTGHILPYKRRRADYGTSKVKPSSSSATLSTKEGVDSESKDGKDAEEEYFLINDTSASVLQQADVEEPAVESVRDHDGASSSFVSTHRLGSAENAPVKSPDDAAAVCTTVKRDDDDAEVGVHWNRASSTDISRKDVSGLHSLDKSKTKISKDCAGESDPQVGAVEALETTRLGLGMQSERFLASKNQGELGASKRITDAAKLDILVPSAHDADNKQWVMSGSGSHLDVAASPASEVVVISQAPNAGNASATRQELCNGVDAASPRSTETKKVHTHINKQFGKKQDSQLDKKDKLVLGNVADAVSEDSGSSHKKVTSSVPEDTMGKSGEAMEMDPSNEQFPPSTRMHETILHSGPISRLKGQQKLVGTSNTECNDSITVLQSKLANERHIDINECLSSEREDEMKATTTPIREPLCNNSNFLDGIHASPGNGTAEPTSLSLPSSPSLTNSNPSTSKLPETPIASHFVGFPAESTSVKAITPSVTPQFPKHALERGRGEGNAKASLVGRPLFRVATPPPHTSTPHEKSVISTPPSSLSEECLGSGPVLQQSCVDPAASTSVTSVISEDLDPQLSNLVSGLPVPPQRIVQELQSSVPVIEVNAIVAEPIRKPRARSGDSSPSPLVSPLSGTKELARTSLIQGPESAGKVSSRLLERSRMERENTPPMDVKESSLEDGDESPNSLLVEDVKVCDICGNAGYEEMLAICCSCSEGAEHIYCMRTQMDSLPDFDWYCETCLSKQKQGGSKTGERLVAPSSTLGRSASFSSRSKSLSAQGCSRSRLTDRLNHKKPRIAPVRKSPSKAPTVQTTVKRLATDSLPFPMAKKMVVESSLGAPSSVPSPAVSPQTTNSTVRPLLTRENTFKSSPDTGKVKFLAPSAVASFSGARANAAKSATLASQSLKAGTFSAGQANIKSRFASLSSITESSPPSHSNKATNSSSSQPPFTSSPTPVLTKSSSGKFSADLPSFLLNSNSRQGNSMKVGGGQAKSSRDASVSDAPVCPPHSKEASGPGAQSSGSKSNVSSMVRLGRNMSIGGSPVEPRSLPDSPRPSLDNGRSSQRTASPSMPGVGPAPESFKLVTRDGLSPKPEQVSGVGAATGRGSSTDPCSLPGFLGKQSKSANVWSAPWLGAPNNTRCAMCKGVGHSTQDCPSRTSSPLPEQKVTTAGISISPNTSPGVAGMLKEAVPTFSDIDAHVPVVDVVPTEKVSSGSSNLAFQQSGKEPAPQAAAPFNKSAAMDFSKNVTAAPAVMMDTMPKHLVSFKNHNMPSSGSKVPSLLNSNSFRQLVAGQQSAADDGLPSLNGDALMNRLGAKMPPQSSGISTTPSRSYGVEGPPGVPGMEACNHDFVQNADVGGASAKQIDGLMRCAPKVAQGPTLESPDAGIQLSPPPPPPMMLLPNRPMWGPRPPWMDGLPPGPPLAVSGPPGPGPVGYPLPGPGMGFPPSGNLMYGHHLPMPYMTSPPPPPPPPTPYAPPPPPQSPAPPATPTAVPNDAIAWRGAFEVFDGQTTVVFDEILAHVSTRAVAKVHEVATGLPQRLCLEQVERSLELETWPRQFNARPPTDGSIALYFFATNGESFERFRHKLVDHMVNHDLVLRTQVDDAELLIFPSSKLLEQFQRWHGHMFLWGVFRARKATVPPVVASASIEVPEIRPGPILRPPAADLTVKPKLLESSNMEGENTGEMDMEVDMEGGKECGVADKAVKRLESVNNRSPISTAPPGGATIKAAATSPKSAVTTSHLSCPGSGSISPGKLKNIAKVDLDLPPGFAHTWKDSSNSQTLAPVSTPTSTLVLNPVPSPAPVLTSNHICLPVPVPGLTLPPGFEKKIEALKQVGAGSNGDAEAGEGGSSVLKRALSSKDGMKAAISTWQPSPKPAPSPRENESSLPASTRPLVTRTSRSTSRSPSRRKDVVERDAVRERLDDRVKERQRRDRELKHGRDKSRDRGRESHRDRGDRERDRRRERDRPRTRDRSREWVREREREREREKERNRERLLENRDKSRKHRSRDSDKELNSSRPRYSSRRSRSCSRSRSPARRKVRSRSPGRRKVRSRSPARQRTQSPPSPQRRYSSYRQRTRSVSDSLDTLSEASQGAPTPGTRSWREDGDSLQGKRRSGLDKDAGDKSSRPTSRPKARPTPRMMDDTRSESAGASNSRIVATKVKTVPVSSSVTPVLDMNEGVSGAFSGEGAVASTSLPDLNTQNESVESGVLFHDFLPADDSGPSTNLGTASPIAEQPLFPGLRCTVTSSPSIRATLGRDRAEPSSFSAVARVTTQPEYTASPSAGYQFIKPSDTEVDDTVDNPNPDLELALGGRERTLELVKPLPLFVQLRDVPALHSSSPDLAFGLHANSPDLRVGLSTAHSQGSGIGASAATASLSLSLAVPQYRKEGNSWVQVEDNHQGSLGLDDVDFALTL